MSLFDTSRIASARDLRFCSGIGAMIHLLVCLKLLELTSLIQFATTIQFIQLFTASVAFASWKHRSHFETQEAPLMLLGRRLDMGKTDEWVAMIKWLLILEARWF